MEFGGNQLLALEAVDQEVGRCLEVETRKLLGDHIETFDGTAVVVLVVADDQLLGHALDVLRVATKGLHGVGHGGLPP
jgi:hypothetical protein